MKTDIRPKLAFGLAAAFGLALAACQQEAAPGAAEEPIVLHMVMEDVLAAESTAVINVLINAMNDQGEVDPAKLSDEDWTAIEASVSRLHDTATALRDRPVLVVANPGDQIEGEENPVALKAADVQARVDADPDGFKAHAADLLAEVDRMQAAIPARDAATMWDVALNLDPLCLACHEPFWYPEPEPEP